jgi:hypothetical protein
VPTGTGRVHAAPEKSRLRAWDRMSNMVWLWPVIQMAKKTAVPKAEDLPNGFI